MQIKKNSSIPIKSFYDRYKSGKLVIPSHQELRGDIWPKSKKEKWWKDIQICETIPGVIITYQLSGSDSNLDPWFINDGANRVIHSIISFIENYHAKRAKELRDLQHSSDMIELKIKSEISDILNSCCIQEQGLEYDSHIEAIDHFVNLNMGTLATPYEILTTKFVASFENWKEVWKPLLDEIHNIVNEYLTSLGCQTIRKRETDHKHKRDSLQMFCRFASEDSSKWSPSVAASTINPDTIEQSSDVELKAIELMKKHGIVEIKQILRKFNFFIKQLTGLYKQTLSEQMPLSIPSTVHMRWYYNVAIYHKNNNADVDTLVDFTSKLIKTTGGRTSVFYKTGCNQKNTNCTLAKISGLPTILSAIGVNDFLMEKPNRKRHAYLLFPGIENSHSKSFNIYGEGETLPESGILNRHRGNRDMTEEEINRLRKINKLD